MEGELLDLSAVKVEIKVEQDDERLVSTAEELGLTLEDLVCVNVDNVEEAKIKVEDVAEAKFKVEDVADTPACLTRQRKKRHERSKSSIAKKKHECEVCGCKYKTEAGLKVHQRRLSHHVRYRCNICQQGFLRLVELQSHRISHHNNEKPFVCDICGKSYAYKYNLFNHVKTAHLGYKTKKKKYACRLCEKVYSYPRSLRLHMAAHMGTNVFICDICGKSLTNKDHLKFHRRIHTGEKPYVCETCGKGFCKSCNLTLHRRVHTGEKPYKCDCCKKAFSQRSTLVIHMRLHTGQKPFVCFVCQHAFICRALLNVHLKNHRV